MLILLSLSLGRLRLMLKGQFAYKEEHYKFPGFQLLVFVVEINMTSWMISAAQKGIYLDSI